MRGVPEVVHEVKGLAKVGRILRRYREQAWMTEQVAAEVVGISVRELRLIEAGDPQCHFDQLLMYGWAVDKVIDFKFVPL